MELATAVRCLSVVLLSIGVAFTAEDTRGQSSQNN